MRSRLVVLRYLGWRVLFPLLAVVIGNLVLLGLPQAREALFALDDGDDDGVRSVVFALAYLYWAFAAWFSTRTIYGRIFPHDVAAGWSDPDRRFANGVAKWLPRALGIVATLPIAIAMFWVHRCLALCLLALAVGFHVFVVFRRRLPLVGDPASPCEHKYLGVFARLAPRARWCLAGLVGVSWVVFLLVWIDPVTSGRFLGSPALLLLALGGWTLFGSFGLAYLPNIHGWPTLNWLPALLFVAFSSLDNHPVADVRHDVGQDDWRSARPALASHFDNWMQRHRDGDPVYFVAVAGGASRAAYWSAVVLGHLEDRARSQAGDRRFAENVFVVSSVSGGSLGAAAFVSVVASTQPKDEVQPRLEEMLGQDSLAPVIGSLLYSDFAQRLVPVFDAIRATDRSLALEQAWIDDWREHGAPGSPAAEWWARPMTAPYTGNARNLPSMILNTVRLEDGQRMLQSNLKFSLPAAFDLFDPAFDTHHLTLAGAVHNSARFPWVSPAGTVRVIDDMCPRRSEGSQDESPQQVCDRSKQRRHAWGHLGDGGYHEASGAATLSDVIEDLQRSGRVIGGVDDELLACKSPLNAATCRSPLVIVVIDNQPTAFGPSHRRGIDGRPRQPDPHRLATDWHVLEATAPLMGLVNAWSSNSGRAEWRLATLAGPTPCSYLELRYPQCPRVRQPSMNWQLDRESRDAMEKAVVEGCSGPDETLADAALRANLGRMERWIANGRCTDAARH